MIASAVAAAVSPGACSITAQSTGRPSPVVLDYGLEIRDYRLFPTPDVPRFIVELHNTTDEPMDMPTVGFTLPHFPAGENFGFAGPSRPVLHPHTSGALIGVAPEVLTGDGDWGTPEWVLCSEPATTYTDTYELPEVELGNSTEILTHDSANLWVNVTNRSDSVAGHLPLFCDVYDRDGRVCGVPFPIWWHELLAPGASQKFFFSLWVGFENVGNPFWLVPDTTGLTSIASVQPPVYVQIPSCPGVFPWNRG